MQCLWRHLCRRYEGDRRQRRRHSAAVGALQERLLVRSTRRSVPTGHVSRRSFGCDDEADLSLPPARRMTRRTRSDSCRCCCRRTARCRRWSRRHLNSMLALTPLRSAMADTDAPGSRHCCTRSRLKAKSCCLRLALPTCDSLFMVCTISRKRTPPSGSAIRDRCLPPSHAQARVVLVGLLPYSNKDAIRSITARSRRVGVPRFHSCVRETA